MARNTEKILPAVEPPRSCLDCRHHEMAAADSHLGDHTPLVWRCGAGWWEISQWDVCADEVRRTIFVAQACPDFAERPRMGGA